MPIVGLEPSCVAVFKDELREAPSRTTRARPGWPKTMSHFAEFFEEFEIEPPPLARKAFSGDAITRRRTGSTQEVALLRKMGVEVETLDAGCCGLAGWWDSKPATTTSRWRVGELGLLPAVRDLADETLVSPTALRARRRSSTAPDGRASMSPEKVELAEVRYTSAGPEAP